ncbi:MAG: GNAT family N-acetyltransferase [Clostridia bacterium]|nr:GNAT family N-acetyltransferase [Clostridia bacterium]
MKIVKVNGLNKDFYNLCKKLEDFQFNLIPILKQKNYTLTDNLQEITGFVLYSNNLPIGCIGLKKINDDVCEIVRVFVEEKYRGNGYASLLFDKIENLAKELNFKKLEMVAWCDAKSAVRLYEKVGYSKGKEKISEWFGGYKYVEFFKLFE